MLHFHPPACKTWHVTPARPPIASSVLKRVILKRQTNPLDLQTCRTVGSFRSTAILPCTASRAHATPRLPSPSNPYDRMLGYPIVFIDRMFRVNRYPHARVHAALRPFFLQAALLLAFAAGTPRTAAAQQTRVPSAKGGVANLEAKTQGRKGDVTTADGDVDIHYGDTRLRADHVEYNGKTYEATATGHVQLDYGDEHLEANEAHYNVSTGYGRFHNVRGTIKIERRPNPALLISDNPLYFEARDVERFPGDIYLIHRAWITICDPQNPKWQFYAPNARIHLDKTVALINANFRLFRVPLIWLPYASAPAGRKVRASGVLIPDIGQSSRKGFIFGDAFYLAPTPWMDATLGVQYLSRRGVLERESFRAKPFENTSMEYSYFGVQDRGLLNPNGTRSPQGGDQQRLEIQSLLPGGWRFVTDYNHLSSLTFRLAFADSFGEAINSEVRTAVFLTNNFRGFSLNFAGLDDKSFLTLPTTTTSATGVVTPVPGTSVTLRNLPEARFGSVEQSPWRNVPVYFGFDAFTGVVFRSDQIIQTFNFVDRYELAPRVTVPLHFGSWLGVTTSAAFRTTRYGDSYNSAGLLNATAISRNTGEFTVELRPPTFQRFFDRTSLKKDKARRRYKHTIEPALTYRYVTGVNRFAEFVHFDSDATLTNTSEVEYGITQRLFRKDGDGQPEELLTWRIVQKHYFDPTFGGAIVDGQRNVFQALDSISPFAFAFGPRNWSPIVSDFKIMPGGPYDVEQILQYDPQIQRLVTIGTLLKVKPYREFFVTTAYFRLNDNPSPLPATNFQQPLSNQVRALVGYGSETRKGLNLITGVGYDFENKTLQNQIVQLSYNGGCCGLAVEYRRINLGQVRAENQFRLAFIIANIGTFGNLRHQEKIF
jgi:LPS-assembly protein